MLPGPTPDNQYLQNSPLSNVLTGILGSFVFDGEHYTTHCPYQKAYWAYKGCHDKEDRLVAP
jgi:hypothetical protein